MKNGKANTASREYDSFVSRKCKLLFSSTSINLALTNILTTNAVMKLSINTKKLIERSSLLQLPRTILDKIFSHLNLCDSVCLALSSKNLYALFNEMVGPVKYLYCLTTKPVFSEYNLKLERKNILRRGGLPLHWQIRGFMGKDYYFCNEQRKFVHRKSEVYDGCLCWDLERLSIPYYKYYESKGLVGMGMGTRRESFEFRSVVENSVGGCRNVYRGDFWV